MTNADSNETVDLQAETVAERTARPAPVRPQKSAQATMLMLTGLAATLFGLALSILPLISWKATKVMLGLDFLGVQGGALVVGGMTLVGLGMIRRSQVAAIAASDGSDIDSEIVEQVAADVVQMRNAVDHMQSVVGAMQDELRTVKDEIVAAIPAPVAPQAPEAQGGNEDAIFRMAASLDKVGAKIEERLKSQFSELQGRLSSVESSVREVPVPAAAAPVAPVAPVASEAPVAKVEVPVVEPVQMAPRVEAPQPVAVVEPIEDPAAPAQDDHPEGSLGVLDTLDDEVVGALPGDSAIDFDQIDNVQLSNDDSALPAKSPGAGVWEEELEMVDTGDPDTDEQLRSALEDMRRTGEQPNSGADFAG
jgi:hypothetical protein